MVKAMGLIDIFRKMDELFREVDRYFEDMERMFERIRSHLPQFKEELKPGEARGYAFGWVWEAKPPLEKQTVEEEIKAIETQIEHLKKKKEQLEQQLKALPKQV